MLLFARTKWHGFCRKPACAAAQLDPPWIGDIQKIDSSA
jgi:hypothetical protein